MKRLTCMLAAAVLAAALAGCGGTASSAAEATPTALPDDLLNAPATKPDAADDIDPDFSVDPEEEESPAPDEELSGLVQTLYAAHPVDLMLLETRAVDLSDASWTAYHTGLNAEQAALTDAAIVSESQTGSQAYSLVLLRVKDKADAETVAQAMLDQIDPAKWVCVMADTERAAVFDDKILFVMADSELLDVNALMDAAPDALGVRYDFDTGDTSVTL